MKKEDSEALEESELDEQQQVAGGISGGGKYLNSPLGEDSGKSGTRFELI
ncbi:MAG: hypothetical protein IJS28_01005 [Synergistaceae bacterium]|nr:hypothetical protein [Synergistaceae bacterium]